MIKVGDNVRVISKTEFGGEMIELVPLGTICIVTSVDSEGVGIVPVDHKDNCPFFYLASELEKGSMVWVPELSN